MRNCRREFALKAVVTFKTSPSFHQIQYGALHAALKLTGLFV
jgi:hypothetical protein